MEHSLLSRAAEYLNQQRQKKRWQKGVTALAAVVVFCTTYALILPAITMEAPVFCGQEEHVHEVDCREQVLICDLPQGEGHVHADLCWQSQETMVCGREESDGHTHGPDCQQAETLLTCVVTEEGHVHGDGCYTTQTTQVCGQEEAPGHAHTDACREITRVLVCTQPEEGHVHGADCSVQGDLTCGCEEHTHTDACYSDPQADLESAACWERTFAQVTLTGDSPTDLLAIAETQLGYTESSRNYIINDQGRKQGYSRYGGWYGDPYGDWCAMFVSFCLHYANIPPQDFPREASCQRWIQELTRRDLYRTAGTCQPQVGDLIFFNWDQEPDSDHVGLVKEVILNEMGEPVQIETIEGNASNQVKSVTYAMPDGSVMGYGQLPRAEAVLPEELESVEEVPGLPPEEQVKVDVVIEMIEDLPDSVTAEETLLSFEEYEDWEGYEAYFAVVAQEALLAYEAYEALTEEGKAQVTNYGKLRDLEWLWGMTTLELTATTIQPGRYGNYTFAYNETTDAFLRDPSYAAYYNENSPLGTAGSFHLVAFGTASLNTHTNGNVLAHTLKANSNFGTNNYSGELSYVVNYETLNSTSASSTDHILVVGSGNTLTLGGNRDYININNTKIDKPYHILQDKDTAQAPFIDLDRVEQEVRGISDWIGTFQNKNVTCSFSDQNNREITLAHPDGIGVYNMTAAELNGYQGNPLRLKGFQSGHSGTIIINVNCSGVSKVTMPQSATVFVDGQEQGTNEVVEFSSGKVIWNFRNAGGCTVETQRMTGMVVAPGATVNIKQNLNGTVVAENISVQAESHRTDFTGTITRPSDPVGGSNNHIIVQPTVVGSVGTRYPGTEFDLYQWDGKEWDKVNDSPLVTDQDGQLTLTDLEPNTAYRVVETKPPEGYSPTRDGFDFWVKTNGQSSPSTKPSDFSGGDIPVGGTLLVPNDRAETPPGGPILPDTGGTGSHGAALVGVLLTLGAGFLLYRRNHIFAET